MSGIEVHITPVPILGTLGCCVPIVAGSEGDTTGPPETRTELCAIDAHWIVGMVPTCDVHLRKVCVLVDWGWEELVAEAGRDLEDANRPWVGRQRHSQEDAREAEAHFR